MSDHEKREHETQQTPAEAAPAHAGTRLRKVLRIGMGSLAVIVGLTAAAGGGALLFLRSDTGEAWLTRTVNEALQQLPSGLSAHVDALHGPLPTRIRLSGLTVSDGHGAWLEAEGAELRMDWSALPQTLAVAELTLNSPKLLRLPETAPSENEQPPSAPFSLEETTQQAEDFFRNWPDWLPGVRIDKFGIVHASLSDTVLKNGFQATLQASASLNREGAKLSISLARDNADCPPLQLEASLSPELAFSLEGEGSDLGLLSLLPDGLGEGTGARFTLTGSGTPETLESALTARLLDGDNAMLTASASVSANLSEKQASAALKMESGRDARRLWALAGQKSGSFRISVDADASEQKHGTSVRADAAVELADMDWSEPALNAILGPSCVLKSSARADRKSGEDTVRTLLEELSLSSERLQALAHGTLQLSPDRPLLSSSTNVELHTACTLADAGTLSSDLSGSARFSGDLSGTPEALRAAVSLKGDKLKISGLLLENMQAGLELPHADIPRLLTDLPRLAEEIVKGLSSKTDAAQPAEGSSAPAFAEHTPAATAGQDQNILPAAYAPQPSSSSDLPLLSGRLHAAARINGQNTKFDSLWSLEENGTGEHRGLTFSLDGCDLGMEENSVQGRLRARLPFLASERKEGTVAALLGLTPPALDGELNVRITHWEPLARISGLKLAGSPLSVQLTLSSQDLQALSWQSELSSFRLSDAQGGLSLSGLKTELSVKDVWGKPDFSLQAGLNSLKTPGLSLSRVAATAKGNAAGAKLSLQSSGDVRSDVLAAWKPGEGVLQKVEASVSPSLLGLSGNSPAGLRLLRPAAIRYKDDTFSTPGMTFTFQPAGQATLSGSWSPKKVRLTAALKQLDLKKFRTFVPGLPSGMVECRADMEGTLQHPTGNLKLNLKDIRIPGSSVPPVSADVAGSLGVSGKRRMLTVLLELPEESKKALGLTESDIRMHIPFTSPSSGTSMPDMRGPLYGEVVLDGELGQLWRLLPLTDQRLAGQVHLAATLSGTPSAPVLTLHGAIDNGRFAELVQGVELRNIRLRADADKLPLLGKSDEKLTITLSADDSRRGSLSLNGWIEPSSMRLSADGTLNHLSPLRRQDINIMLSGSLGVTGTVTDPSVRGDITVERGQVQLVNLPGGDIVTLPIEDPGQKEEAPATPLQGTLNVRVRIPNQFFIRGYGLECEWKGDILARGLLARPSITGEIQAVRGGLDVLGKHFDLSEGRISLDGGWPVSPMLNIIMEYESSSITADVAVSGPATKPNIALSSQPSLPQDEIISQIMFGQSAGNLSHVQALQLAAGAAELAGLGGGADVMGLGRRILGLDVFKLNSETASGEDGGQDMTKTSLEMGTYVRDNIYVGVEQGIGKESETDAVVEIELTPSLEAQAKASSTRTEFGLEWKKNY